jgi:hypothetical protein
LLREEGERFAGWLDTLTMNSWRSASRWGQDRAAKKRKSEIGFESQRRQQVQHAIKQQKHKIAMLELKRTAERQNVLYGLSPKELDAIYDFENAA